MEAKLNARMDLNQIITAMADGNSDTQELVSNMMKKPNLYRGVIICDKLGIRGEKLFKLYYACCDSDDEKLAKTLQMFESNVFSFDEIQYNLDLLVPEAFLDESIVSYHIPLYSVEFNINHPNWEEFAYLQRRNLNLKLKRREILEKISEWIVQGQTLMYPDKYSRWEECVITNANDNSFGKVLVNSLEIMTMLENGSSLEQTKQILQEQSHSNVSLEQVRDIVLRFSNRGPDFYVSSAPAELSFEQKFEVDQIRKENVKLAEKHSMIGQNNIY